MPSHLDAVVKTTKISRALQATWGGPSHGDGTVWSQFGTVTSFCKLQNVLILDWKNIGFMLFQKIFFFSEIWSKKLRKKNRFAFRKKCVEWFFSYKNCTYWFLRAYCEKSAHTEVPNFFPHFELLICHELKPWYIGRIFSKKTPYKPELKTKGFGFVATRYLNLV